MLLLMTDVVILYLSMNVSVLRYIFVVVPDLRSLCYGYIVHCMVNFFVVVLWKTRILRHKQN